MTTIRKSEERKIVEGIVETLKPHLSIAVKLISELDFNIRHKWVELFCNDDIKDLIHMLFKYVDGSYSVNSLAYDIGKGKRIKLKNERLHEIMF